MKKERKETVTLKWDSFSSDIREKQSDGEGDGEGEGQRSY